MRHLEEQLTNREILVEQLEGALSWADTRSAELQALTDKYEVEVQRN